MQRLLLKKNEETRIAAGHLWIYSNEIETKFTPLKKFQPGELVQIIAANGNSLGVGYVNPNTLLAARILTRNPDEKIDQDFFCARIKRALALRNNIFAKPFYRLIFGESDGLPGLVVDRFNDVLVMQLNTAGMENLKAIITQALITVLNPSSILCRNDSSMRTLEGLPEEFVTIHGEPPQTVALEENGINFTAAIWKGQKTGWFFDQRNNRARLRDYVSGKNVLDVCSYTGGFGINAAVFGAKNVHCLDSSDFALQQVKQHAELNKVAGKVHTIKEDVFVALKDLVDRNQKFDVIILDPPAFIKRRKDSDAGMQAYLRIHKLVLQLLPKDGILITTSCSLHLSRDMLLSVIRQAGFQEKCELVILEQLHQAQDHPVHLNIPETDYLKGFIVKMLHNTL